jgi:cell division protein FtsI (penicillin-binding protein 3)
LTRRIGATKVHEILEGFGFGTETHVDMDFETKGVMRDPRNWDPVTFANISFGQGVAVSPIQLVAATAAIGNEGKLMRPRLVSRVHTRDGRVLEEMEPEVVRQVIRADTATKVIDAMKACVEPGGTGTGAAIPGYTVAGKTGTAQKPATGYDRGRRVVQQSKGGYLEDSWIASFVGLVPAENPRLALLVLVDEPEGRAFGGVVAAPIFREIGEWTLKYLGVPPSNVRPIKVSSITRARDSGRRTAERPTVSTRTQKPVARMTVDRVVEGIVPNFQGQGMGQVAAFARAAGIELEIEGSGRVVHQSIRPGTPVNPGTRVVVRLEPIADRHSSLRRADSLKGAQL